MDATMQTVLRLHEQGIPRRTIAKRAGISLQKVRKILMFLLNNKLDYRTQNFTISLLVVILKRFMFFSSCCYLNIFQIYSQSTCSCDMDDFSKTQNQQLLTFEAAAGKSV